MVDFEAFDELDEVGIIGKSDVRAVGDLGVADAIAARCIAVADDIDAPSRRGCCGSCGGVDCRSERSHVEGLILH